MESVKGSLLVLLAGVAIAPLRGDVSLPPLFGDHMVIQHGCPFPVWGDASPGERIVVTCGGFTASTTASPLGHWRVMLPSFAKTPAPLEMSIDAGHRIVLHDILVGDVWLAAGSGEIAQSISEFSGVSGSVAISDYGTRFFVPHDGTKKRRGWVVVSPTSSSALPAVPFFFARDLRATRQNAIGILDATVAEDIPTSAWIIGKEEHSLAPIVCSQETTKAADMIRKMITTLLPFPLTGVLWGQGYADEGEGAWRHRLTLHHLVRGWRSSWGEGPIPFLILSSAGRGSSDQTVESWKQGSGHFRRGWPWIRDAMESLLDVPSVGVVEAFDLGGGGTELSFNPLIAGRRAALLARSMVYGENPLESSGPRWHAMTMSNGALRVRFDHAEGGLVVASSAKEILPSHSLDGFSIRESGGKWFPAEAIIDGEEVVLSSPSVRRPDAVRYGWSGIPHGNLYNRAGLPASPFRTDRDQPD